MLILFVIKKKRKTTSGLTTQHNVFKNCIDFLNQFETIKPVFETPNNTVTPVTIEFRKLFNDSFEVVTCVNNIPTTDCFARFSQLTKQMELIVKSVLSKSTQLSGYYISLIYLTSANVINDQELLQNIPHYQSETTTTDLSQLSQTRVGRTGLFKSMSNHNDQKCREDNAAVSMQNQY